MFDLDGNGTVEEEDRRIWVEDVFGTFFGDANLNKEVAFADFLALSDDLSPPVVGPKATSTAAEKSTLPTFCCCQPTSVSGQGRLPLCLSQVLD